MSYSTLGFVMTQRAAFELMMCLFAEPMVILGAPAQHHHHHHLHLLHILAAAVGEAQASTPMEVTTQVLVEALA
jgi:hypothetical protein